MNIEAAKKAHGPAFQEAIQSIFGSMPEMQYFEAPIVIDNSAQQVVDNAAQRSSGGHACWLRLTGMPGASAKSMANSVSGHGIRPATKPTNRPSPCGWARPAPRPQQQPQPDRDQQPVLCAIPFLRPTDIGSASGALARQCLGSRTDSVAITAIHLFPTKYASVDREFRLDSPVRTCPATFQSLRRRRKRNNGHVNAFRQHHIRGRPDAPINI